MLSEKCLFLHVHQRYLCRKTNLFAVFFSYKGRANYHEISEGYPNFYIPLYVFRLDLAGAVYIRLEHCEFGGGAAYLGEYRSAQLHSCLTFVCPRPLLVHPTLCPVAGVWGEEPRGLHDCTEAAAEDEEGLDAHWPQAVRTVWRR